MGLKLCSLAEGNRYRVKTARSVYYGVFYDREAIDGEQYLLFIDDSKPIDSDKATIRIRASAIRNVEVDWD